MTLKYEPKKLLKKWPSKMTLQKDTPWFMHTKLKTMLKIKIIRYKKRVETEFLSSKLVRFSKQISNANIPAPRRDNSSKFNQDELTPERFYYLGFISELKRFFWHIRNLCNCNGFGDLTFLIGFSLRITWTLVWYDHMIWLERMCRRIFSTHYLQVGWFSYQTSYKIYSNVGTS